MPSHISWKGGGEQSQLPQGLKSKQAEEPTLHVELHRYACIADDYWARGK